MFDRIHPTVVATVADELDSKSIKRRYGYRAIIVSSSAERIAAVQAECVRDRPTEEMLLAQTGHLTIGVAEVAAHAGHEQMRPRVRLPISILIPIPYPLRVGVQEHRRFGLPSVHVIAGGGAEPGRGACGFPVLLVREQRHPRAARVGFLD